MSTVPAPDMLRLPGGLELPRRAGTATAWVAAALAAWAIAAAVLPSGAPSGVVLLGVVIGALSALTAMGLVLIYRSSRIVNFAQAEIGGLAASVALVMVIGWKLPYVVGALAGLAVALATGLIVDLTTVRHFFTAPRLILTVATIGVAQVIGAGEIWLPTRFKHLSATTTFSSGIRLHFTVGPVIFSGDDILAMAAVPAVLAALTWFLGRSDTGIAIRAAADSNERATLLGIPVRNISRVTWMVAAGLSGVGAILSVPVLGPNIGEPAGATSLLAPLAAAVVGRMQSLPATVAAALGIGVLQQVVFWNYGRSSTVDVALFVIVLLAVLLQRKQFARVDGGDLGSFVAVKEVRPVPAVLRSLPEVRAARLLLWSAVSFVAFGVPLLLSAPHLILVSYIAIFGIIAVSLVVLTGWAGQISLGQFAFVGVGAAVTASLLVHAHEDLFVALFCAAVAGAASAVLVGVPALRVQGLFLAVTTLAFAVPVSTFLLSSSYFPLLNPVRLNRPILFERWRLDSNLTFYYLCLAALVFALFLARNYRRTRAGRAVLAVRDNERGAASLSIPAVRTRLVAFAFSGALAGLAGGLYSVGLRGVPYSGFSPDLSLTVFVMVVIGGIASLPGAILGAVYVEGCQYFLHGSLQLLATGAGLLWLLTFAPGGIGEVVFAARDRLLRLVAHRRALSVPSLAEKADLAVLPDPALGGHGGGSGPHERTDAPIGTARRRSLRPGGRSDGPGGLSDGTRGGSFESLLGVAGADAYYGRIQVLFGVDIEVTEGEMVALLGTNGAGKSTLLRVAAGLLPSKPGHVYFAGKDITKLDPVARVKEGLVVVPGGRGVFPTLTVRENLRMAGWVHRRDQEFIAAAHERVFDLFPILRTRLDLPASFLSGGEQQMLTLAQALFCRPRLLLIDELSLGLAPSVVAALADVVRRINADGTTVVLVEQSVNLATSLARRAVFMEKGQVRFTGPVTDLTERPDLLRSVFLEGATGGRSRQAPSKRVGSGASRLPRLEATSHSEATVLSIEGITKSYGGVQALRGVDLSVGAGRILGIIGSNGAGKTTLFDVCSGFVAPDEGRIQLEGRDVTSLVAAPRAGLGLGRSFQDARIFPSMTVTEALATAMERHVEVRDPWLCVFGMGAAAHSEAKVFRSVEELIERMNLTRYRDAFISELSTGTRRIVELAAVMAHDPSVILLDEPSSGIAQRESEALAELLGDLRQLTGAALVVIEHDIPLVSSIADEMACMHLGAVIARGSARDVLNDPAVAASYLGTDDTAVFRSGRPPRRAAVSPPTKRAARGATKSAGNGSAQRRGNGVVPDGEATPSESVPAVP